MRRLAYYVGDVFAFEGNQLAVFRGCVAEAG